MSTPHVVLDYLLLDIPVSGRTVSKLVNIRHLSPSELKDMACRRNQKPLATDLRLELEDFIRNVPFGLAEQLLNAAEEEERKALEEARAIERAMENFRNQQLFS